MAFIWGCGVRRWGGGGEGGTLSLCVKWVNGCEGERGMKHRSRLRLGHWQLKPDDCVCACVCVCGVRACVRACVCVTDIDTHRGALHQLLFQEITATRRKTNNVKKKK